MSFGDKDENTLTLAHQDVELDDLLDEDDEA